jgi:7,8-dihydro-6-hydroxymethylpterin-pyrophosphokinase
LAIQKQDVNYKNRGVFSLPMLKFIKRLFQKEDVDIVLPKQTVSLEKLPEWLDKHTSKKTASIAELSKPLLDQLDDAIFAAQENIKKLRNAQLKNKSISGREFSIMKGNRESYIRRTEQFLRKLSTLYDNKAITYADMKDFHITYKENVVVLNKALMKPYAVLQHFFSNESYAVAQQIKKVDKLMTDLDILLQKESQESVEDCKKQIATISHTRGELRRLTEKQTTLQKDLSRVSGMQEQAQQKLTKVEASEGYKKYLALVAEEKEHLKKVKKHAASLSHSFAVMDKAFRKFAKQDPSCQLLIDAYCDDPIAALHGDSSLGILPLLVKIKGSIVMLDLKDDKKAKTLDEIGKLLAPDFFVAFLAQDKILFERKHQLEKNIKNHFSLQQYKEASYMVQTYSEKSMVLKKDLDVVGVDVKRINMFTLVEQLQKDLHQCTKFEVEIILS